MDDARDTRREQLMPEGDIPRTEYPVRVGSTNFGVGIPVRIVMEAARNNYLMNKQQIGGKS